MSQINECVSSNMSYIKLKRFILFASPESTYIPGRRMTKATYVGPNLAALRVLLNDVELSTVFETIEWIQSNELDFHEEIIPLVLSECCRIVNWRTPSLEFALKAIKTGREFLIFSRFCFKILPSIGQSEEVLKFISDWYLAHDYEEVAEMALKLPILYSWKHGRVMQMADLQSDDPARAAVYAFEIGGLEKMNKEFMDVAEASKMVSHFNRVANYRQVTDPQIAAEEMALHHHSITYVNSVLQDNKKVRTAKLTSGGHTESRADFNDTFTVWKVAIPQMDLIELMNSLKTMSKNGLLRCPVLDSWDPHVINPLCDRLESLEAVLKSKIHPARSFIEQQRFENQTLIKHKYALINSTNVFPLVKPDKRILEALESQMEAALNDNIKPANMDISVVIDTYNLTGAGFCAHRIYVMAHKAAAFIASCLKKSGDKVDIVAFGGDKEINLVSDETKTVFSMARLIEGIDASNGAYIKKYLSEKVSNKDLIVVIGSRVNHEIYMDIVNQHNSNPRKPKFVFCSLKEITTNLKPIDHERVLLTAGFDAYLVKLIIGFGMKYKF